MSFRNDDRLSDNGAATPAEWRDTASAVTTAGAGLAAGEAVVQMAQAGLETAAANAANDMLWSSPYASFGELVFRWLLVGVLMIARLWLRGNDGTLRGAIAAAFSVVGRAWRRVRGR